MESLDEASRTATMHAKGTDKRGQGGANATIVSTMRQEGEETVVDVATDFTITGRLARFGRGGMIEDISKRMMRDFSQCLQASRASGPTQEAAVAQEPAAAAAAPVTPGEEADAAAASAGGAAAEASAASEAAPAPPAPQPAPPRAAPPPAKPIKGFSLLLSVLWDRIKRLFGRGEK
jgi:uncharacterized membrane protein